MKVWAICVVALILTVNSVNSKVLEFNEVTPSLQVKCTINRNPPIVADNELEIEITNAVTGDKITGAEILVNYYMPPMPRMAPMNYKTRAKPEGDKYVATLHIIMAGPWVARIIISYSGKKELAKISFDAQ